MKHLLNTLYILSHDTYLALDGENVVILDNDYEKGRLPLHTLESIVYFGYKGVSPALICKCAQDGIDLCFFSYNGRFRARVCSETRGNVLLRKQQYAIADNPALSLVYAKNFIIGKFFNSRKIIERHVRDYNESECSSLLKAASNEIACSIRNIEAINSAEALLGAEGNVSRTYFSVFNNLILSDDKAMVFNGRSRRPPLDRVNAMLSFAYSLLAKDCASALESVGLDPYVGFFHCVRPGRTSLALDLMEELRSPIADRFVLSCINRRIIKADDFLVQESGAVLFCDDGMKKFITEWQKRKKEEVMHPFLKEKVAWGLVPYTQAILLSRTIRGDLSVYPSFMVK